MPYRPYRSDRRSKRRRWLLIILTTLVVITAIAYLVSRETQQRSAVEFLAAADQASDLHEAASAELESTLSSIGVLSLQELTDRLASVMAKATEADELLDVEVPPSVAAPYGSIRTASSAWVTGVTDLNGAIATMIGGDIGDEAVAALRGAIDTLRAGDVAYSVFLETVEEPIEGAGAVTFDSVTYINPDAQDPLLYDPLNLAIRVATSYELSPHHDISVVGQFEPEPVGDRGGIPLVPFSDVISLTAIVTNLGNEAETDITVNLEVFDSTTNTTDTQTQTIAVLDPNGSGSVVFADLDITPGNLYQVKLTATILDEGRPDDNVWVMSFIRNGDS